MGNNHTLVDRWLNLRGNARYEPGDIIIVSHKKCTERVAGDAWAAKRIGRHQSINTYDSREEAVKGANRSMMQAQHKSRGVVVFNKNCQVAKSYTNDDYTGSSPDVVVVAPFKPWLGQSRDWKWQVINPTSTTSPSVNLLARTEYKTDAKKVANLYQKPGKPVKVMNKGSGSKRIKASNPF